MYIAPGGGDRVGYRGKKDEGAPGGYRPQYAGVGRGAARKSNFCYRLAEYTNYPDGFLKF